MNKEKTIRESSAIMSHMMLPADSNPAGLVHGGVIMKHIDNAAGVVAVRHTRTICVTASIDRIDFHNPVFTGNLIKIWASLNMVGNTSMEIGVRVESEDLLTGEIKHTASAYLTFVALGDNFTTAKVPRLILETDEEKRRNKQAQARPDEKSGLRKNKMKKYAGLIRIHVNIK